MVKKNRAFKGVWIPKEVYLDERLTWSEKILIVEVDSLDNGRGCFASNQYLANFIGVNRTTISTAISKLVKLGYIVRKGTKQGQRRYLYSNLKIYKRNDHQESTPAGTTSEQPKNSLFSDMVNDYDIWCKDNIGVGCKMDGIQGKALKSIISYLRSQVNENGDEGIKNAWSFILANWNKLDDFHQKQMKLSQINSNLINILNQLRNGGKNKSQTSIDRIKDEILNS